jgi:hypothetical protein
MQPLAAVLVLLLCVVAAVDATPTCPATATVLTVSTGGTCAPLFIVASTNATVPGSPYVRRNGCGDSGTHVTDAVYGTSAACDTGTTPTYTSTSYSGTCDALYQYRRCPTATPTKEIVAIAAPVVSRLIYITPDCIASSPMPVETRFLASACEATSSSTSSKFACVDSKVVQTMFATIDCSGTASASVNKTAGGACDSAGSRFYCGVPVADLNSAPTAAASLPFLFLLASIASLFVASY